MVKELFEENNEVYTRFIVSHKYTWKYFPYLRKECGIDTGSPSKENGRYIYFEAKGNFVN